MYSHTQSGKCLFYVFTLLFLSIHSGFLSQTTIGASPYTVPSTGTYTIPEGVTSITVDCWGGGGGGGGIGSSANDSRGGGGGGGACSTITFSVTPGTVFNIDIGTGGTAGSSSGGNGGNGGVSRMYIGATIYASASGGSGGQGKNNGTAGTGGAGGTTGLGSVRSGGNGIAGDPATGSFDFGGSGGGGAGTTANGSNGNASVSGNAPVGGNGGATGGGKGGNGAKASAGAVAGSAGATSGGGGGGASRYNSGSAAGGAGAAGKVIITYTSCIAPAGLNYTTSTATYCAGTAITNNSPSLTSGVATSYSVSPALPTGLSLNTTTGVISGTPTTGTANASYVVTATNSCGNTTKSLDITINSLPTATLTSSSASLCYGNTYSLGGSVTASGAWSMGLSNGGTVTGTGSGTWSQTVTPAATTTYTITSLSDASCAASSMTGSTTLTLPTAGTTLSTNESATCAVSGNNWIHFYNTTSGRYIVSINPNGNNLGNVTATSYVDAGAILTQACGTGTDPFYTTAVMGRRWSVTPQYQPNQNGNPNNQVYVKLPFADAELTSLVSASSGTAQNPFDNVSSISNLKLSKYSGANVNGSWSDNCIDGGTVILNQFGQGQLTTANGFVNTIASSKYVQFNLPGFSEFWLHNSENASPLPVTLTSLSATCMDNKVSLNWTTASEINSQKFVIEKSRDLDFWSYAGQLPASGNSNYHLDYMSVDSEPYEDISYYRLVQFDNNGTYKIYGPISVSCSDQTESMIVFPNPTNGNFTVEVSTAKYTKEAEMILTDLAGKLISSLALEIHEGKNQIIFNNVDLQSGVYVLKLVSANQFEAIRVVIH